MILDGSWGCLHLNPCIDKVITPEPRYPPETQQELLATTLQPIVSFAVLGSIIIREKCLCYGYKVN
ncbi:hypothetical protein DFS33DRAFT_1285641, partial [Desarmillaria ectypa]